MRIWGQYLNRAPEVIDTCKKSEAPYLVREYRMAFGAGWHIWAGTRKEGNWKH